MSQDVNEGYRLVRPAGTLASVVVHLQWLDNHLAGSDPQVMISFTDGTDVELAFDIPVTMLWHDQQRPVTAEDLAAAPPSDWGAPAPGWAWRYGSRQVRCARRRPRLRVVSRRLRVRHMACRVRDSLAR